MAHILRGSLSTRRTTSNASSMMEDEEAWLELMGVAVNNHVQNLYLKKKITKKLSIYHYFLAIIFFVFKKGLQYTLVQSISY